VERNERDDLIFIATQKYLEPQLVAHKPFKKTKQKGRRKPACSLFTTNFIRAQRNRRGNVEFEQCCSSSSSASGSTRLLLVLELA